MNKEQALARVQAYLDEMPISGSAGKGVVLEDRIVEKSYGWVFIYNSQKYIETGNILYAFGGNGPIIIEKTTGELHQLGSAMSLENSVREFEEKKGYTSI